MVVPLSWKLCLAVFLSTVAGNVVGSYLYDRNPAPQLGLAGETRLNGLSERHFPVIETIPPFVWKS